MKTLAEFQDEFQRAVVDGDDTILAEIVDSSKENRHTLLGVYRNAYVLRLIDFLANDYEKLQLLLGEDQFAGMAHEFIAANPSHTTNARWFGVRLPEFLRRCDEYPDAVLFSELAGLERALNDVFDAEDADLLTMTDLGAVPPEEWAALTFEPHPATRRIELTTNANEIWSALHNEKTPPAPGTLDETRQIVVYRPEGMATFRPMAPDEAMMWDEAANGVTFSVLCEMMSMYAGEEEAAARAAGYLQGWINAEMLRKPAASS